MYNILLLVCLLNHEPNPGVCQAFLFPDMRYASRHECWEAAGALVKRVDPYLLEAKPPLEAWRLRKSTCMLETERTDTLDPGQILRLPPPQYDRARFL